jgi:hypothetical protein
MAGGDTLDLGGYKRGVCGALLGVLSHNSPSRRITGRARGAVVGRRGAFACSWRDPLVCVWRRGAHGRVAVDTA